MNRLYAILHLKLLVSHCWLPPFNPHREKGITYSHAFVHFGEVLGRENEKEQVIKVLLALGNENTAFVLPIVV